jgi:hypothetical protein
MLFYKDVTPKIASEEDQTYTDFQRDVCDCGQRINKDVMKDNIYRECFMVAAVMEWKDVKPMDENEEPKLVGDDKYLFGLPTNLDEAIEVLIDFYSADLPIITEMDESTFKTSSHFGAGTFIRNSWFLWFQEPNTQYAEWPRTKPPIVQFFNNLGITHADDMSSIILVSTYRKIHNYPQNLEEQIKIYKNHWRKEGFKDGVFKPTKS